MTTMRIATVLIAALVAAVFAHPAAALSLIRDAEIERTLSRISGPLFRAAAVNPATVDIYIVDDPEPNAFVAGGRGIFIHTGLLTELDGIDELRAVLAHELGHITGGHLTRRDQMLQGARGIAMIGMIGAAAATLGGAPGAGIAIASSSSQAALRTALAHGRAEEAAADQAALRYLSAAGSDPAALLGVLDHFRGQEMLSYGRVDPYAQSHPLWSERIALLEERVAALPPGDPPPAEDVYWHGRMVAKLGAFLDSPAQTLRRHPESDRSETAMLARAIAWNRRPDPGRAAASLATLLAARPDDPYYLELRGQFLLESGRAAPAAQAYRQAIALAPGEALILGGLGRALLNVDAPDATREARDVLARSADLDPANAAVLRDLALAEARLGNEGAAALATAERFTLAGEFRDAHRHAERAAALLPRGAPGWRRAEDIVTLSRRALKREP